MATRLIMIGALCLVLGGCASGDFCSVAKPLTVSKHDVLTRETKNEVVAHNETGEKLCGRSWTSQAGPNAGAATRMWLFNGK